MEKGLKAKPVYAADKGDLGSPAGSALSGAISPGTPEGVPSIVSDKGAVPGKLPSPSSLSPEQQADPTIPVFGQQTVVFVEDDPLLQELIRQQCGTLGVEAYVTGDVETAGKVIGRNKGKIQHIVSDGTIKNGKWSDVADVVEDLPMTVVSGENHYQQPVLERGLPFISKDRIDWPEFLGQFVPKKTGK